MFFCDLQPCCSWLTVGEVLLKVLTMFQWLAVVLVIFWTVFGGLLTVDTLSMSYGLPRQRLSELVTGAFLLTVIFSILGGSLWPFVIASRAWCVIVLATFADLRIRGNLPFTYLLQKDYIRVPLMLIPLYGLCEFIGFTSSPATPSAFAAPDFL